MLPAAAFLLLFLAYPLGLGIWLSFTDAASAAAAISSASRTTSGCGTTAVFWLSVFNTLLYTGVASVFKFAIGLYLAILLNQHRRSRRSSAIVLIPFIERAVGHRLLVDLRQPVLDVSWSLRKIGLIATNIDFLGDTWNARWSVIFANIWRGVPFIAITLLAGLQTVPPRSTRRRPSTAPAAGRCSATSPTRCSPRSSPW